MSALKKKEVRFFDSSEKKYCFISGIIAFAIMIFTYLCHSNSLFGGDQTVLRMDLYHQYGPLYAELYDRIVHGYSLVYSWTSGLGGGFLGNLFNYCCSPFALIILLLGHKNMPEAIALMILLKAVLSSVTFTYYLNKSEKRCDILSSVFGTLYTFSGFFVAYSWNIMWLDAMSVFPLVILGIERIIDRKKPLLFILSLAYTMITNYYMAYMVCILSVIFFLFYYFSNYNFTASLRASEKKASAAVPAPAVAAASAEENIIGEGFVFDTSALDAATVQAEKDALPEKEAASSQPIVSAESLEFTPSADAEKTNFTVAPASSETKKQKERKEKTKLRNSRFWTSGWTFAGAALFAFVLSAFALLPVYFCLQTSSATSSSFPDSFKTYFNMFEFAANHLPAVDPTIRSSGDVVLPNIYCGLLTVMLLPFYFLSSKISGRKKIAAICVLGLFFIGFNTNYLNYIWHGFHFPNDLPYRYSFAYSFFLLTLAYQVLGVIREFTRKQFIVCGGVMIAFAVLLDKFGSQNVDDYTIVLTILFSIIYVIIGGVFTSPQYLKKSVAHLLVFIIILEICFANTGNYTMSQSKKSYTSDYDQFQQVRALAEKDETELFYRTEQTKLRARMDASWYGYPGVSTFSSMAYEHTSHMMERLGMFGNDINSYTYYPQTPIFNSMFSLKYLYDNSDMLSDGDMYTFLTAGDRFKAYRYNYYLPIAFSVSDHVKDWNIAYSNPFEVQNDLMAVSAGIGDCLVPVDATDVTSSNLSSVALSSVNNGESFIVNKENTSSEATATVYIDVEKAGEYYVYAGSTRLSSIKITAEDFNYEYISSSIQPFILGLGNQPQGARIAIEYNIDSAYSSATLTFCAARLNENRFKQAYNRIVENGVLAYASFGETDFSGVIDAKNSDGFLFTSIPYDESWVITLDGKQMSYYNESKDTDDRGKIIAVGDGLIGFDIGEGKHTVTFHYRAKGLEKGILISLVGWILLCLFLLVGFLKKKKAAKKEKPSDIAPTFVEAPVTKAETVPSQAVAPPAVSDKPEDT